MVVLSMEGLFTWLGSTDVEPQLSRTGFVRELTDQISDTVRLGDPEVLMWLAGQYGAVLAELGDHVSAVRLQGSLDAMRERNQLPRGQDPDEDVEMSYAKARAALAPEEWRREYQRGRDMTIEVALNDAHTSS